MAAPVTPRHWTQSAQAVDQPAAAAIGGIPLPPVPPSVRSGSQPAAPGAATPVAPGLDAGQRTLALRPFVGHARGGDWVALVREQDAVRTTFDVPAHADVTTATLDVRLRNGADVLPAGSVLSVLVNGERLGDVRPDAVSAAKTVRFELPPALLKSRDNELRVLADHAHRVSCSETGSFELWSEFDPQATGLTLTYPDGVPMPGLADLGTWLRAGAFHARTLPVLQSRAAQPDALAYRAVQVAQGLAGYGGARLPAFQPGWLPEDPSALAASLPADGLGVLIAPRAQLARYLGAAVADAVTGPYLGLHRPTGFAGARVLVVSGRTPAEVSAAADRFATQTAPAPTAPITTGPASAAVEVAGDRPVTLTFAGMGLDDRPFDGVAFTGEMAFRLAADAFPRQQQEAEFDLIYRHTGPLGEAAELVVWINGAVAATRTLDDAESGRTVRTAIGVPLSRFRPGLNRVDLAVSLPYPDGVACPDRAVARGGAPRFRFDPASTLSLPAMPRLHAAPELHTTAAHAAPYAGQAQPVGLVLPALRQGDLAAAMTLAGQLRRAGGTPLDLRVQPTLAHADGAAGIVVATLDALDPALLAAARIDRSALADLLRGSRTDMAGLRQRASVDEWVGERVRRLQRDRVAASPPAEPVAALIQVAAGTGDGAVWTAVTADTPQQLAAAAGLLAQPDTWEALNGAVALLGADGEVVVALAPHRQRLAPAGEMTAATAALIAGE